MKLLSERLSWAMSQKAARDGYPVIPAHVARAAKVSNATLNYWLKDVNGISGAKARLAGAFLNVNPIWLETGEGDPTPAKSGAPAESSKEAKLILAFPDEEMLLDGYRRCDSRVRQQVIELISRESGRSR